MEDLLAPLLGALLVCCSTSLVHLRAHLRQERALHEAQRLLERL